MAAFQYPRDMVVPLREGWHEWYPREADIPDLPNDELLATLLETAYHASFTLDEQRQTRLTIVVCAPDGTERPLPFSESRPFTVHELMRLGPVASSSSIAVGVTCASDGPPTIWGLCSPSAFMQLTLTVTGPGALDAGRNQIAHCSLRGGKLNAGSGPGVFSTLADFLRPSNNAVWEGVSFAGGSWSPQIVVYPTYALQIARTIARAGHGGAVLMIPDSDAVNFLGRPDHVKIKYACNDDSLWPKLRAVIQGYDEHAPPTSTSAGEEAEVLIDRIARLAAVDGAVLLTDRLRLLGFGAEVTVQSQVVNVVRRDGSKRPIEDFGTRHRSAFRFCSAYPAGLALVCSQDGGVKAIQNVGGAIHLFEE